MLLPETDAPWIAAQRTQLLARRGHAWLLQGPSGLGQYALALSLLNAWLCEQPTAHGACGQCPACRTLAARSHSDLYVLMPEAHMLALGWPLPEKAQAELHEKKRKPGREIRIDAMRQAIGFCQRTSARARGKAVLVYPAEHMNAIAANALLKTLEEPPGDTRFVLASEAAHQLLPTIRSRCQAHSMRWPDATQAQDWLVQQTGQTQEACAAALRGAGGRPGDALALLSAAPGAGSVAWPQLPRALSQGDVAALAAYSPGAAVLALQKICHDLMALSAGAAPRYFLPADLPASPPSMQRLLGAGCAHGRAPVQYRPDDGSPGRAGAHCAGAVLEVS